MALARIKKGDIVVVKSGVDAGKTGTVESVDAKNGKALVKGINLKKKAMRRTENQPGGIIEREAAIALCKLMPYDADKKSGTRVKTSEQDGKKIRVSVKSGKNL